MSFYSFSFRNAAKTTSVPDIKDTKFINPSILSYAFDNYNVFVEMGGIYGIAYGLRTILNSGLPQDEKADNYQQRKDIYGENRFPTPPTSPLWKHITDAWFDPMLMLLTLGGALSILINVPREGGEGAIEGCAILLCVAIVMLVSGYQNWSQEQSFFKMAQEMKDAPLTVLRDDGVQIEIEQTDLLVGDILFLQPGQMIPADGILIDNHLKVNESALTGEPDELDKNAKSPFLSGGTSVADGAGSMLVTSVGINSRKGKLMAALAQDIEETPLQKRLEDTALLIGYVGATVAGALFLVNFIRLVYYIYNPPHFNEDGELLTWNNSAGEILNYIILCVSLLACAIPEGLALSVVVSLSYSLNAMKDDNNFVKQLSACETSGGVTYILTDKTGTLTSSKMTVCNVVLGGKFYHGQPKKEEVSNIQHDVLINAILCNGDKRVTIDDMKTDIPCEDWNWSGAGGATESALVSWLARYYPFTAGQSLMDKRVSKKSNIMMFYPFSSAKKYSSVIMQDINDINNNNNNGQQELKFTQYFKGAADNLIKRCNKLLLPDGTIKQFDTPFTLPICQVKDCGKFAMRGDDEMTLQYCEDHSTVQDAGYNGCCTFMKHGQCCDKFAVMGQRSDSTPSYCTDPAHHPSADLLINNPMKLMDSHPLKLMTNMTRSGLRCIAFTCVNDVELEVKNGEVVINNEDDIAKLNNHTLIGIAGIKDPLRKETTQAIHTVQNAGVTVVMMTGDNLETAKFIAKDCGILSHPRQIACDGAQLRQLLIDAEEYKRANGTESEDFLHFMKNLRVVARCQPEHKLDLVTYLKDVAGEIVAVTGDGSNDAPALKKSDVGLAMGIAGTDVAKAAADIVILDDNFNSIVRAVLWGRCVISNIKKFIQFQLSANVCSLLLVFVSALTTGESPINAMQLLFLNLIMDSLGALGLATEIPKTSLLHRQPYDPKSKIISLFMWKNILGQALSQLIILFLVQYKATSWGGSNFWGVEGTASYDTVYHHTYIYHVFIIMQVFNLLNSRRVNAGEFDVWGGALNSPWFLSVSGIILFLQFLIIQFGGIFFKTTPIHFNLWLVSFALGATQLLTGFLLRLIPTPLNEGQITLDPITFEGAVWKEDEEYRQSLPDLYKTYAQQKYEQNSYLFKLFNRLENNNKGKKANNNNNNKFAKFENQENVDDNTGDVEMTQQVKKVTTVDAAGNPYYAFTPDNDEDINIQSYY